jgi:hypothetical protein
VDSIRSTFDKVRSRAVVDVACSVRLLFGLVVVASFVCSIYASLDARGLYHDGAAYLVRIWQRDWFSLGDVARTSVQALRQAPLVGLLRLTPITLFQGAQVFTFSLLFLPAALCSLCWFIAPRGRRGWILFPLAYLLIGFAETSFHAIGEAAIATAYYWILLFLLTFRTRDLASQSLFLVLATPAFRMHEGAFSLTGVLLFCCTLRIRSSLPTRQRMFLIAAAMLLSAIFAYQMRWIIYPQYPADRAAIVNGLLAFKFLYFEGHWNLPLITGTLALLALATIARVRAAYSHELAAFYVRAILALWFVAVVAAISAALTLEHAFAPFAQLQARYHPIFVSAALGAVMVMLVEFRWPDRVWLNPATVAILGSLCIAQSVADVVATQRWRWVAVDLQSRLARTNGLISWEGAAHTGDNEKDNNFRLMMAAWTAPFTSIVLARTPNIRSLINLPAGSTYRPVDPEKPDGLPKLRGITYSLYQQFYSRP